MRRLPSDWRKRIEIVEDDTNYPHYKYYFEYRLQFVENKSPKGFQKYIGKISVVRDKSGVWIEEVEVSEYFRNRGLGLMLYYHVIEKHGSLSTHYYDATVYARRVWKSLCRDNRHEKDFWKGTITVFGKKKRKRKVA